MKYIDCDNVQHIVDTIDKDVECIEVILGFYVFIDFLKNNFKMFLVCQRLDETPLIQLLDSQSLLAYRNLTELRLGRNNLKSIDFSCLPNLCSVSLFSNYLEKIDGLEKLTKLWTLDVRNNLIET